MREDNLLAKFESPEINVVLFSDSEVITTSSGGYSDNDNNGNHTDWSYNSVTGGADGDFPL